MERESFSTETLIADIINQLTLIKSSNDNDIKRRGFELFNSKSELLGLEANTDVLLLEGIEDSRRNHEFLKEEFNILKLQNLGIEKDIQRLYYVLIAERIRYLPYPLYIPHYYDFRGRMYPNSSVSFMYLKLMRPFFKTKPLLNYNLHVIINSSYYKLIMSHTILFKHGIIPSVLSDIDKYFITILFLEIGKLKKSNLIVEGGTSLQDFIDMGVDIHKSGGLGLDSEELGYFLSLSKCLDQFLVSGV